MMPPTVHSWVAGASMARMKRDHEQARADALQRPTHEREEWLRLQKNEAEYRHSVRMAGAEKLWPQFVVQAEEEFCRKLVAEMNRTD